MTPAEVLRELGDRRITIVVDDRDRPGLDDPDHQLDEILLDAVRHHSWLLRWVIAGQTTGHQWAACEKCDEVALIGLDYLKSRGHRRRCLLTFGCDGCYRAIDENQTRDPPDPPARTKTSSRQPLPIEEWV